MRTYSITGEEFRSLAAGGGTPGALDVLVRSQLTKRRLSIRAVAGAARAAGPELERAVRDALELLQAAEAARPDAVRTVLAHPHLDVWAADCLRALAPAGSAVAGRAATCVGHLGALAAAAAVHAGLRFDVTVPSRGGMVVLPTVGVVRDLGGAPVEIHSDGSVVSFRAGDRRVDVDSPFTGESRRWFPQRHLTAVASGSSHTVMIEDIDPYRDCYQWLPMERLSGADADRMGGLFQGAWELLVRDHPVHAAGIRATLRSLVPLAQARPDRSVSATSSRAFGALGVSLPEDPATLALLLIHEFQHMKLSALLDLVDLCRPGGAARYFAPWRPDPRPPSALLQGVYAHAGVVDFWRRHRLVTTGVAARAAEFEFALWREQTARATDSLLRSGALTELGVRFVGRLAATLADWRGEPVPAEAALAARDLGLAGAVRWRMSHRRPAEGDVRRLAEAWHAARPCPPTAPPVTAPGTLAVPAPALVGHLRALATGTARRPGPAAADAAYLAGRYQEAADGYAALIGEGRTDAWIGLALATARLGRPGGVALERRPDLVRQLYTMVGGGRGAVAVADWLAPAIRYG